MLGYLYKGMRAGRTPLLGRLQPYRVHFCWHVAALHDMIAALVLIRPMTALVGPPLHSRQSEGLACPLTMSQRSRAACAGQGLKGLRQLRIL